MHICFGMQRVVVTYMHIRTRSEEKLHYGDMAALRCMPYRVGELIIFVMKNNEAPHYLLYILPSLMP